MNPPLTGPRGQASSSSSAAATHGGGGKRMRILNFRLLVGTLLAVLVLGASAIVVHRRQVHQQAQMFLEAAAQAEANEDWREAANWLRQYLAHDADNVDALGRLAEAVDKGARTREEQLGSVANYGQVLDKDPDQHGRRARLAELQLLSNPKSALDNAEKVLSAEPDNLAALRVKAVALDAGTRENQEANGDPGEEGAEVVAAYLAVLKQDPGQTGIARRVADIYRRQAAKAAANGDPEAQKDAIDKANAVMDEMVAASKDRALALLARHRYRMDYGEAAPAAEGKKEVSGDLLEALAFAPDNAEVRLAVAGQLVGLSPNEPLIATQAAQGLDPAAVAEARDHLLAAIANAPKDARGYLGLSELFLKSGEPEKGVDPLESGLREIGPHHPLLNARLAVLMIQAERWDAADAALARLEQSARDAHVRAEAGVARRLEAIGQLLRAEWLLEPKNPGRNEVRAAGLLKSASEAGVSESFSAAAAARLGKCHAALRQWDLAVSAFRSMARLQPGEIGPRVATADALASAGRHDEAAREYAAALEMAERTGGSNRAALELPLAHSLFREQLRLPRAKRDWRRLDELLAGLKRKLANSPRVVILDAQVQLARVPVDQRGPIVDALKRAEETFADVPEFWRSAMDLYLRLGELDAADKAMGKWEELTRRHDAQGRARLLLARGDIAGAEELLRDASSSLGDGENAATLASLAWLGFQTGRMEDSLGPLRRLAATEPGNLGARFLLAQIAAQSGDAQELKRWVQELKRIEGPEGSLWVFFQIQSLLLTAQEGNELALKEAASLARQLVSRRPGWYLSHAAEGMINEAQGRPGEAITSYQQAFELGDRRPILARRLLSLALLREDEGKARELLDQMPETTLASPEVLPLAAQVLIRGGDVERAIDLARAAIVALPVHAENHVVLGQALLASGQAPEQLEKAAQAFRRAVELAPGDVSQWIALLYLHANHEHPDGSVEGLKALRGTLELLAGNRAAPPPARMSFLLGRALALAGDPRAANALFREAIELSEAGDRLAKRVGQMALSTHVSESAADGAWTGHVGGLPPSVQRVYAMVGVAAGNASDETAAIIARDTRAQALARAAQGGPRALAAAAQSLGSLRPEERRRGDWLLLARLERQTGNANAALADYSRLAQLNPSAEQLTEYALFALDQQEPDQAAEALAKLDEEARRSPLTLEPRIRLLAAQGKNDEAVQAARAFALAEPSAEANLGPARSRQGRLAAECLAKIGKVEEGTALLREVIVGDPLGHTVLADYLSLVPNGRDEALELCLQAASREGAIRQAWFLANIMAQGETNPELQTRAERFFSVVLKEDPRAISSVVLSLAVLREHQNRLDEAIRLTREALKHEPENLAHRNNLAWFLSSTGDHEAALELIGGVIEEMGPIPAVLDTKGVALLGARRPNEAARALEASLDSLDPSPRTYLHLAEAYDAMGLADEAKRAFQAAERNLRGALPPRDQKARERLKG